MRAKSKHLLKLQVYVIWVLKQLKLLTPDQQITNNSDTVKLICMIIFFTCPKGQKGGVKSVTFLYQAPLLGTPPPSQAPTVKL